MDDYHVLYAEDDENDVFFMRRAFGKLRTPRPLHVVRDGQEAIDYLVGRGAFADRAAHPLPGLLILDIKMPHLSGREVLEWVRQRGQFSKMRVVMLTSSMHDEDVRFCAKAGADAYLIKPSQAEKLIELLASLFAACDQAAAVGAASGAMNIPGNRLLT